MSYGQQLNIFKAKAEQYGRCWCGVVLCRNANQQRMAVEDARLALPKSTFHGARNLLVTPKMAQLRFFIIDRESDVDRAFAGMEYTHIIWLTEPLDNRTREIARSRLRSVHVPKDELRYEYATAL